MASPRSAGPLKRTAGGRGAAAAGGLGVPLVIELLPPRRRGWAGRLTRISRREYSACVSALGLDRRVPSSFFLCMSYTGMDAGGWWEYGP